MEETSSENEPPDSRQIHFTKMHGCGNDFIVIDELAANKPFEDWQKKSFFSLCSRNFAVGADQVLLLERSPAADARMRIIERDGSESDMCGNGIRCAARYIMERMNLAGPIKIETRAGIKVVERFMNLFKVNMGSPTQPQERVYSFDGNEVHASLINTGEPHIVIFTDNSNSPLGVYPRTSVRGFNDASPDEASWRNGKMRAEARDFRPAFFHNLDYPKFIELARHIRYSEEFAKDGVNVNLVQVAAENRIKIRTYERGVENETLSCGTGSTACGVASILKRGFGSPIYVETRGGVLLVDYSCSDAFLFGPAEFVFDSAICQPAGVLPQPAPMPRLPAVELPAIRIS